MNKASLLIIFFILLLCSPVLHAQQDRAKDYILVLHSINFRETWTHQAYEAIRTTLTHDGIPVKGEELQIPLIKDTAEINCKVDYLRQQYPFPPKAVICIGDPAWLVSRPLFDNEWKDVPSLICYSQGMVPRNIVAMVERNL